MSNVKLGLILLLGALLALGTILLSAHWGVERQQCTSTGSQQVERVGSGSTVVWRTLIEGCEP